MLTTGCPPFLWPVVVGRERVARGCGGGAVVGGGGARAGPPAGRAARRSGPAPALAPFPVPGRSSLWTASCCWGGWLVLLLRGCNTCRAVGGGLQSGAALIGVRLDVARGVIYMCLRLRVFQKKMFMKLVYSLRTLSLLLSVQQALSLCGNGYYSNVNLQAGCIPCAIGWYKNWIGEPNTCIQCPTGKTSSNEGSSECVNIQTQVACYFHVNYCSNNGGYQSGIGGGGGASGTFRRLLQSSTCHCCQGDKFVSNTCQVCEKGKFTNLLYHVRRSLNQLKKGPDKSRSNDIERAAS